MNDSTDSELADHMGFDSPEGLTGDASGAVENPSETDVAGAAESHPQADTEGGTTE
jgi:hypothetical protein